MTERPAPTRAAALALAVVLTLALAACGTSGGTRAAASVNGHQISTRELVDEIDAINGNPGYLEALSSALESRSVKVKGATAGSFDIGFVSVLLNRQIQSLVVHDEVRRRGLQADDACRLSAKNDLPTTLAATKADGEQTLAKFPQSYQDKLLERELDTLLLQADLAGQACVAVDPGKVYFDAHPGEFDTICLSLIVAADDAAATAAKARLDAGEAFATVAAAVSQDPASAAKGGDFGCIAATRIPAEFAPDVLAAGEGSVVGPVRDSSGTTYIIKVGARTPAKYEDVKSQATEAASAAAGTAYSRWLQNALRAAVVTVDPRYGTWSVDQSTLIPPGTSTSSGSTGTPGTSGTSGTSGPSGTAPSESVPASSS